MTTRGRRGRRTPGLVVALVLLAAAPAAADCVFVNTNSGANSVAAFAVAPDGTLLPVAGSPYPTGGLGGFTAAIGSLGLAVGGDFLYATNPGSGGLAGFRVLAGCCLLPLPGSPFPAGVVPVGVAADPAAGRLYVTDFAAETVAVYTIASDGTPTPIPGSPFAAPSTPLDLAFSRDGRLYLGQSTVSEVGGYKILPDGAISPLATSPYLAAGFLQGLDLTPDGAYLYVAGRGLAGVVFGFEVLPSGALFPLAGSPFPADDPLDVLADPLGDLLYVSNNLGGTIAVFAIGADGALAAVPGSPFAAALAAPAGLAVNAGATLPLPRILYVAHGGFLPASAVSAYTVAGDGSLAPFPTSPFPTGGTGQAAGIVYLPRRSGPPVIPGVGPLGFLALIALLAGAGLLALRR